MSGSAAAAVPHCLPRCLPRCPAASAASGVPAQRAPDTSDPGRIRLQTIRPRSHLTPDASDPGRSRAGLSARTSCLPLPVLCLATIVRLVVFCTVVRLHGTAWCHTERSPGTDHSRAMPLLRLGECPACLLGAGNLQRKAAACLLVRPVLPAQALCCCSAAVCLQQQLRCVLRPVHAVCRPCCRLCCTPEPQTTSRADTMGNAMGNIRENIYVREGQNIHS